MNKRIIAFVLSCIVFTTIFMTGCSVSTKNGAGNLPHKLGIVCTIFPEFDWIKQILGTHTKDTDLTMLINNGVDLHSFQPTADDIIKVSTCDLFIYVGGESDKWVKDALREATNKNMVVINLLDILKDTVKKEEVTEGMQPESDDLGTDEHVWLSLKNAETLCQAISSKLCKIDNANAADYITNTKNYEEKLNILDTQYQQMIDSSKQKTVLFGDRFPFRYLVDDYGLTYYAAFAGCSAETQASFQTISFLAGKVDTLGLHSILTIEGPNHQIAEAIVQDTKNKNQKILTLDSMQSTTSKDVENGTSYLSIMQKNLTILHEALN